MDKYFDKNERGWCFPSWIVLHAVVDAYPKKPNEVDKKLMEQLFQSLSYQLPCDTCNEHFREELTKYPIQLQSQQALNYWLIDFHNRVNARLGKRVLTYPEALARQKQMRHTNWDKVVQDIEHSKPEKPNASFYIAIILGAILAIQFFKK